MGGVLRELLEMLARAAGIQGLAYWFRDADMGAVALVAVLIVLGFLGVAWVVGKATQHPDHYAIEDDTTLLVRGGCFSIVLGGVGLIFVAAVTWAWRYLFD